MLDRHPLLRPLVGESLTLAAYGDALAALHGIHGAAEAALLDYLSKHDVALDAGTLPRLPLLEADLHALGRSSLPCRVPVPVPETSGAFIGMLYVLEGSRLGARLIARQLDKHLPDAPRRFFATGEAVACQRWQDFCTLAAGLDDATECASAAQTLFEQFRIHLDDCLTRLPSALPCR